MRITCFAAATLAAVAAIPARANPLDTYSGNLIIEALDAGGKVIPLASMTPGNVVATSGWVITLQQTLNGRTYQSKSWCGIATTGVLMGWSAGAVSAGVCGDGSPFATSFGGPAFAPSFSATCSYLTGAWTSDYYSPSQATVNMLKQQSVCNGTGDMAQTFKSGGNGPDYTTLSVGAASGAYSEGITFFNSLSVQIAFPSGVFDPAKQSPRSDMAGWAAAQRALSYNNQLQAQVK